jgi:membrane protease YdiL (CAAX protease family)
MTNDKRGTYLRDILALYFVIFFLWTVYRIFFSLPEWADEFIAKPILWIGPLIFLHKKRFNVLTFERSIVTRLIQNILFGFFAGVAYFGAYTVLTRATSGLPAFNPDHFPLSDILLQGAIALSTGFIEEIVFRSVILEKCISIFNDSIVSNCVVSLLFAAIHLPIILFVYKYPPAAAISYLSLLTISGFIYGLVYQKNRSLAAATATHAVWNFLGTIIR